MDIDKALRLIIAKSPNNFNNAIRALRTAQNRPNARPVQYVLEQALRDTSASFTTEERTGIAAHLSAENYNRTDMLRVRVTTNEKVNVELAAEEAGLTVSEYIRSKLDLT